MLVQMIALDTWAYLRVVRFQHKTGITRFFKCLSFTGDGYFYPPLALCIFFMDNPQGALFLSATALAFCMELPAFILLKKLFKRDRPFEKLSESYKMIHPSDRFSFPSGHSAGAFVMATLLAFFYPGLAPAVFSWAALVALSRVVLGVHYPFDILSGAALGASTATLSLIIME